MNNKKDVVAVYQQLDNTIENDVKNFAAYVHEKHSGCDVVFKNAVVLAANVLHETTTEK